MLFRSSFGWLTVFASGMFLAASRDSASVNGAAALGARAIGYLGGMAVLRFVPALLGGVPLSFVWVAALLFVAAVGCWPMPRHTA